LRVRAGFHSALALFVLDGTALVRVDTAFARDLGARDKRRDVSE
jgi:hypothetical protein